MVMTPDELPGCSTPRDENTSDDNYRQIEKTFPNLWERAILKRILVRLRSPNRDFVE